MISYSLQCAQGHHFDSWFKSAKDYDRLCKARLVECAICGSSQIEKALMAPQVSTKQKNKTKHPAEITIKKMRDELKGSKNVGWQFANEARAIHYGDKEDAPIYGKTEPEEAVKLIKEGVQIVPLPFDPDRKEN